MLLALSDISFGNLASGTLRVTELEQAEAAERLGSAIEAGALIGLYDFGPVPDAQKEKRFHDLLDAIDDLLGIAIPREVFFSSSEDGTLTFPIPHDLAPITLERPLLLLQYALEMDSQALGAKRIHAERGEKTLERAEFDAFLVDTLFPMKISKNSLRFHLLELLEACQV